MSRPVFTLASGDYDRVRALWDGSLQPDSFDLNVTLLSPDQIFARMVKDGEFELSEMSFATYLVLLSQGNCPFVAIPAYPSRKFRHGDIYVRENASVYTPEDLAGLRIGVPEYQLTACVWLRGMFSEDYGVAPTDIIWRVGGLDMPGRKEKVPLTLPPEFNVTPIGPEQTLSSLLLDGELDAILTPKAPQAFPNKGIRRLFKDYVTEEKSYYKRTRLFPIIHVVVLRRDIYEAYPQVAKELYRLYLTAKELCFRRYQARMALAVSLPWFDAQLDQAMEFLGKDYWSYGIAKNRDCIHRFLHYMQEQGLVPANFQPDPAELFAPETRDF